MSQEVILIKREHAQALGKVLASAFLEDPCFCYVCPERNKRLYKMQWVFTRLIRIRINRGAAFTTPDLAGAALWSPPEAAEDLSLWELIREGFLLTPFMLTFREQYRLLNVRMDAMARIRRHLDCSHWVLDSLGVSPEYQGKGVARALLQVAIKQADASQTPSYLSTHNPTNVAFYQHFGFEVIEASPIRNVNMVVTSMRRKPKSQTP